MRPALFFADLSRVLPQDARGWLNAFGRAILLSLGISVMAFGVNVFLVAADIAPTGVTGVAVLLNAVIGTPIGLVTLVLNVPIVLLGARYLGGLSMLVATFYTVVGYGLMLDLIPVEVVSNNTLLNALFGGVVSGLGMALVMRGGGTPGGTATLARIIQDKTGTPMSTTYLYTDIAIILAAGLIFGWEAAMYAVVTLFISGIANDYFLEGPSVIRTVFIVTDYPREISQVITTATNRGVTGWDVEGMYSQASRKFLYVTVSRSQVTMLCDLVASVDDRAFIVVGQGHTAYGSSFRPYPRRRLKPQPLNPYAVAVNEAAAPPIDPAWYGSPTDTDANWYVVDMVESGTEHNED